MKMYLFVTHGDVESEIEGPFKNSDKRNERAREIREDEGDETGVFRLNVGDNGVPECEDYSGGFFDEGEDDEDDEDEAETRRRDEKHGLYGEHEDDAN